jgi:hypothetical protein
MIPSFKRSSIPFLLLVLFLITIVSNLRIAPSAASILSPNAAYEQYEAPPPLAITSSIQAQITALFNVSASSSIRVEEAASTAASTEMESPPKANIGKAENATNTKAPLKLSEGGSFQFQNSKQWLEGNRLSNIGTEDLDFVLSQILKAEDMLLNAGNTSGLLQRSLCHADSRVRNPTFQNWNASNEYHIKEWTFMLIYLAIHSWHHHPAKDEALSRLQQQTNGNSDSSSTPNNYDYECPKAKFMITTIPSPGLGASLRMSGIYSILTGIAIGRIPIFLSNVPSKKVPENMASPFMLGFAPRKDLQSAFLPTTPCVVTMENIEQDMVMMVKNGADDRKIRRKGTTRNRTIMSARYLYVPGRVTPERVSGIWDRAIANIYQTAKGLVDRVRTQHGGQEQHNLVEQFRVWDKALDRIQDNNFTFDQIPDESTLGYHPFRSATLMYMLRLNREQQRQVQQGVKDTLPESFDPSVALGLPIRASDKCRRESTCLSFERYMELANDTFQKYGYNRENNGTSTGRSRHSVVVTTEDSAVANETRNYPSKHFPLIINKADAQQDTGKPSNYKYKTQAASIMRSSMIALTMQMYPTHTFGNCCSNFHQIIFDLLESGCGLSKRRMCLNQHPNRKFRVCCKWDGCEKGFGQANTTSDHISSVKRSS